jgi:hypothetical protein
MLVRHNAGHSPRPSVRCEETLQNNAGGELGEAISVPAPDAPRREEGLSWRVDRHEPVGDYRTRHYELTPNRDAAFSDAGAGHWRSATHRGFAARARFPGRPAGRPPPLAEEAGSGRGARHGAANLVNG